MRKVLISKKCLPEMTFNTAIVCFFSFSFSPSEGRSAFLGLGFGDRSDSFDLNVALQDHFKWVKNQEQIESEKSQPKQELDLGFKEGETIKINMKITVSLPATSFAFIMHIRISDF